MYPVKTAKIIFYFTVLLLIAKPFWGFNVFNRLNPPPQSNILIKIFSKRKQEFNEDSQFNISAVQRKLAQPVTNLFLLFSFFLCILFPFAKKEQGLSNSFFRQLRLNLLPERDTYLLTSSLLI
jgi:hypothetical protein